MRRLIWVSTGRKYLFQKTLCPCSYLVSKWILLKREIAPWKPIFFEHIPSFKSSSFWEGRKILSSRANLLGSTTVHLNGHSFDKTRTSYRSKRQKNPWQISSFQEMLTSKYFFCLGLIPHMHENYIIIGTCTGVYTEDIYCFAVNTIFSSSLMKTSVFSRVQCTSENLNVFNIRDENFYDIHWKR